MKTSVPAFQKYIFVCENERDTGDCCAATGQKIRERLKQAVAQKGLSKKIRVSRAGCLDVCSEGPNVLVMPDNLWFKEVSENDVEEIVQLTLRGTR